MSKCFSCSCIEVFIARKEKCVDTIGSYVNSLYGQHWIERLIIGKQEHKQLWTFTDNPAMTQKKRYDG